MKKEVRRREEEENRARSVIYSVFQNLSLTLK